MILDDVMIGKRLSSAEGDETYTGVVLVLARRYRVVECRNGVQWIIQQRASADKATRAQWRGLRYHRSRDCLLDALVGLEIELSADQRRTLEKLPAWFPEARR